jgi:hypothetical protein
MHPDLRRIQWLARAALFLFLLGWAAMLANRGKVPNPEDQCTTEYWIVCK